MQMLKPFRWYLKFGDGWHNMLLYFSLLAGNTFPGPLTYILLDVGPDELVRYCLTGPFYTWMPEAMNHIEDTASVR